MWGEYMQLWGSQSLKNIDINVYYGGPLDNLGEIDGFPFRGPGIECYYMMIRRKLKTLDDLKRKIMHSLNLNPAWYDIKIIYRYPQEVLHERINYGYMTIKEDKHVKMMFNRIQKMPQVNAAELYVSSEPLVEVDTEVVQQTTTALQFTALDDGCTTMRGYTMGGYMLPSQDHVASTGEPLHPQETHLEEEDEDEDHAANDGENIDDVDEYEKRIERGDFENDMDDHEVVPNFEEENMEYHDEGDADDDIGIQHDTNTTIAYRPPADSFFANTWENMEAVKRALIIYAANDNRNFIIRRSTKSKLCAACVDDNCKWYVGAFMKVKLNGLWMVTSYVGPHTCIPFGLRRDGKMMDSNFVASEIVGKLRQNHTARIQDLWDIIHTKYKHELSYYKDSGTQYNYHTIPRPYENSALLRYVYWAFAPCIAAFQYCRPVISIDGTHLYEASWGWFLECLRGSIEHVTPANGICIISDRHQGIKNAIRQWPRGRDGIEQVYHRYCLRHVASNFNRRFDDLILKALALKAGYATQEAKFESIMQIIKEAEINLLRGVDPTNRHVARCMPYTYLTSEDLDKWT
ncbi:uncharacterized protein LOC142620242 [Castanea sativa]|uniref:uncharacterized protein LOC142620242 n=1 Tax=Castanea sativa TaxID=21020 RepID=UPI003F64CA8C